MVSFSKQLTQKQYSFICFKLKKYQIKSNNPYIIFAAEYNKTKIYVYNSLKLLVQGANVDKTLEYLTIKKASNIDSLLASDCPKIGCDESGTGDYFGGISCAAALVHESDIKYLKELGITDSKKFNDKQIKEIATKFHLINDGDKYKTTKVVYAIVSIDPLQYNQLYAQIKNANAIKAICHNLCLKELKNRTNFPKDAIIVMDEFANKDKYYEYVGKDAIKIDVFTPKAEVKCMAVALASILAREGVIDSIKELEIKLGHKIPLGSWNEQIKNTAKLISSDSLKNFVKLHFNVTHDLN